MPVCSTLSPQRSKPATQGRLLPASFRHAPTLLALLLFVPWLLFGTVDALTKQACNLECIITKNKSKACQSCRKENEPIKPTCPPGRCRTKEPTPEVYSLTKDACNLECTVTKNTSEDCKSCRKEHEPIKPTCPPDGCPTKKPRRAGKHNSTTTG